MKLARRTLLAVNRRSAADRLDSWKAIAAHLGRTVRTVQRWERICELPVHRHKHAESSSIYAYVAELDEWWFARSGQADSNAVVRSSAVGDRRSVGRRREREQLRRSLEQVAGGRGMLVAVSGEPGIGKTTLVEDFLTEVEATGECYVGRGRSSERLAETEAYLALLDALEDLLRRDEGGQLARAMKVTAPLWFAQLGVSVAGNRESTEPARDTATGTPQRLKRELHGFLQAACHQKPVVLFLDDVHWLDPSSVDVLAYISRQIVSLPVMIVVTYRPEELLIRKHPFLSMQHDLQARELCRALELEFLTRDDIHDYITLRFPGLPASFVDAIFSRTEGNPLFTVGVLAYLRDSQVLSSEDGVWRLTRSIPDIAQDLPESVRGMIQRKIDLLADPEQRLLRVACVQGIEFDGSIVATVLGSDSADIEEQLNRLERVYGFVRKIGEQELPDGTCTSRYRFVHVLYQDWLRSSLTAARTRALTREIATALERAHGDRTAEIAPRLAALYETAREFRRATGYFLEATQRAVKVFAYEDAIVLGLRGLAAAAHLREEDERRRCELALLLALGFPIRAVRGFASEQLAQLYERAHLLCTQLNRKDELPDVLWGLWANQCVRFDLDAAQQTTDRLQDLAQQTAASVLGVQAGIAASLVAYYRGNFEAARGSCLRTLEIYDPARHGPLRVTAGWDPAMSVQGHMAWTSLALGYPDRAAAEAEEGLRRARELAHVHTLVYALFFATIVYQWRGDHGRFQSCLDELRGLAFEYQLVHFRALGFFLKAQELTRQGKRAEGLAQMREALARYDELRARTCRSRFVAALGEELGLAERPDEGLTLVGTEIDGIGSGRFYEAELLRVRGELLRMRDVGSDAVDAERSFTRAIEVARAQHAKSFELRALVSLHRLQRLRPDHDRSANRLQAAIDEFTEGFTTADLLAARALLDAA